MAYTSTVWNGATGWYRPWAAAGTFPEGDGGAEELFELYRCIFLIPIYHVSGIY